MLNPLLDAATLAGQFQLKKRIQIRDALLLPVAERLHQCLEDEVPWGVAYVDRTGKSQIIASDKVLRFTREDWSALNQQVQDTPADEFQFFYNSYMMLAAYREKRDPGLALNTVVEFLNSDMFLGFVRQVTGVQDVVRADAQATRYIPGSFLRKHNDINQENTRRVAYVINLTKGWHADWGGVLQFLDEAGCIEESYFPLFNTLTLFMVPMWHNVSYVVPSAAQGRYAITGWAMRR
ncbi:MAG TPA: 2OG-Fe(II) oxygenase family protein [Gammaproteobacteria bacterium]|nr:2OG-Fe(II) oxygenase family protein [Gammaproteobacteria bacterium]